MPGLIDTSTDGSTGLMSGSGDIPVPTSNALDFSAAVNSMYIAVVI